jgi:hypothetical protein
VIGMCSVRLNKYGRFYVCVDIFTDYEDIKSRAHTASVFQNYIGLTLNAGCFKWKTEAAEMKNVRRVLAHLPYLKE